GCPPPGPGGAGSPGRCWPCAWWARPRGSAPSRPGSTATPPGPCSSSACCAQGTAPGLMLFFAVLTPVAGVTSQSCRLRQASSAAQREQSRVLVWALSLVLGAALFLFG